MTSFWRFVIHGSPLSHRVFVPAGPGSYEGRYDGTSCKFSGGMQWMPGQHTIQKPSAFQTQLMFFRKDFPLFFFKYQSFFETSENLSHLKKHIFLFLRRLAMISTFRIHPLWENSDTYLLTIGCLHAGRNARICWEQQKRRRNWRDLWDSQYGIVVRGPT